MHLTSVIIYWTVHLEDTMDKCIKVNQMPIFADCVALYDMAQKSPLNQTQVADGVEQYIKPLARL